MIYAVISYTVASKFSKSLLRRSICFLNLNYRKYWLTVQNRPINVILGQTWSK